MKTRIAPKALIAICALALTHAPLWAQRIQFPPAGGLRPIESNPLSSPPTVPINPATQAGIYPNTLGTNHFDPYGQGAAAGPQLGAPILGGQVLPPPTNGGFTAPSVGQPVLPPSNTIPMMPGMGQSANINTFPNNPAVLGQPGVYPNYSPNALFPGAAPDPGSGPIFGGFFRNLFNGIFGGPGQVAQPTVVQPGVQGPVYGAPMYGTNAWNPQGTVFGPGGGVYGNSAFVRFFQGPRFRHAYIYGNDDRDALAINDTDVSLAFLWPNFLLSNQPLYVLPSFSLHQWDGPHPDAPADLPPLAYSAFLDSGWQSDPNRILGAELGLRVGMFSDFDTSNSDSIRVLGRGIGRLRLTPRATIKGGVIYLDRNRIKLLPAGGILWQPQENTRLDIFFPEPKLSSYLTTIGNTDTWWYAGGYYGGGSWTIQRASGSSDSIDINDLRIVLGLEFGRNADMRDGRRNGFFEFGLVFDRELRYKHAPLHNMDLQDTFMFRAGFGY